MFRAFADVIGMTLCPEAQLARELEMCYLSLAMITDYDVWAERPVDVSTVLETMAANQGRLKALLSAAIPKVPESRAACECPSALKAAGA
jgi:5'-methylthioadenosine phosphorylase